MPRDKTLAKLYKGNPCIICKNPGEGDHILAYKGHGNLDVPENIWPLCRWHHIQKHSMGLSRFAEKYKLEDELINRGYWFCSIQRKWKLDFNGHD